METTNQLIDIIQQDLIARLPGYLQLLGQMVEINSFTTNREGVDQLGELTASVFKSLGFTTEKVHSENPRYGHHIFLYRRGKTDQTIALISHLDTVFSAEEERQNQFYWRQQDDRIYGPGTVDIKGGTVLILMVLEALQTHFPEIFNSVNWLVAIDASEEVLSDDFGKLLLKRLDKKTLACLVFEGGTPLPVKYSLVTARKGKANFKIQVEGRSAHAGNRHAQGANAIVQIAHTVQQVAQLTDYDRQLTYNVGIIQGGSVVNRVPHYAEAEVEMRTFSPDVFKEGVRQILALGKSPKVVSVDGYSCKVNIRQLEQTQPWPKNSHTDFLFSLWRETGAALGMEIIPEERGGLSDGNLLWRHHPTIDGLGPVGNHAHCSERSSDGSKDQEYVLLSSFVPKALLNTLAIKRMIEHH
jgi:glutamate carboxypeptidase